MKRILVIGSSPNVVVPPDVNSYYIVAANASIAAFVSLVPDVLMMNCSMLVDEKEIGPASREGLKGRHTRKRKLLIIHNAPFSFDEAVRRAAQTGLTWNSLERMGRVERKRICEAAAGIDYFGDSGDDVPSTGVTAICYSLLQTTNVTVSGISPAENGHSYCRSAAFNRQQVDVDSRTLTALSSRIKLIAPSPVKRFPAWCIEVPVALGAG
jgi:hypothetical protein